MARVVRNPAPSLLVQATMKKQRNGIMPQCGIELYLDEGSKGDQPSASTIKPFDCSIPPTYRMISPMRWSFVRATGLILLWEKASMYEDVFPAVPQQWRNGAMARSSCLVSIVFLYPP